MSITIRQAKLEDASFLAEMILQSSRAGKKSGLFDLLFPDADDIKILDNLAKLVVAKRETSCSYKNFLIAEIDEKRVGTLCSYEFRKASKENFIQALNEIGSMQDFTAILDIFYSCSFEQNKNTLMFDFMEEVAGFLDVGVLKALMQKSLLNARLKGYRVAHTIIEIGSLETELFYTKLGFKKIAEMRCESYQERFGRAGLMLLALEF